MLEDFNPELNNPVSGMELAGIGNRFLAAIIDGLILGIPITIIRYIFFDTVGTMVDPEDVRSGEDLYSMITGTGVMMYQFFTLIINWGYSAYFESSVKQATPGKQVMKIKVVTDSGQRMTFSNALGRAAAKTLSGMLCCFGYIIALFRQDQKTLHDILANTLVVKD